MSSDAQINPDEPQLSELSQTVTRTSMLPELEVIASHSGSETTTLQGSVDENEHSEDENNAVRQRYANPSSYRFRQLASKTVVSFGPDDPENPHNWSNVCQPYLCLCIKFIKRGTDAHLRARNSSSSSPA